MQVVSLYVDVEMVPKLGGEAKHPSGSYRLDITIRGKESSFSLSDLAIVPLFTAFIGSALSVPFFTLFGKSERIRDPSRWSPIDSISSLRSRALD